MGQEDDDKKIISDLLHHAIPVSPSSSAYVTHEQLGHILANLERQLDVRLENVILKTRNWVLGGVLASALVFGGGFITLVNKIDRMAEALPRIAAIQDSRGDWMQRQGQRDATQDQTLQKLDKEYEPVPYDVVPR